MSTLSRNIEFLRFDVAGRTFCVDVDQVLGVITLPPNLKEMPSIVPFHDESLRVFSVEKLLEFEEKKSAFPKEIIVLAGTPENYGISVDLIGQIYQVPINRSVFRFPGSDRSRIKMFGVWGMARLGHELALILEPEQLLKEQVRAAVLPGLNTVPGSNVSTRPGSSR